MTCDTPRDSFAGTASPTQKLGVALDLMSTATSTSEKSQRVLPHGGHSGRLGLAWRGQCQLAGQTAPQTSPGSTLWCAWRRYLPHPRGRHSAARCATSSPVVTVHVPIWSPRWRRSGGHRQSAPVTATAAKWSTVRQPGWSEHPRSGASHLSIRV